MDVLDTNTSLHYVHDGAELAPSKWQEIKDLPQKDEAWFLHTEEFLRWHTDTMGSPNIHKRRRGLYVRCQERVDPDQLTADINCFVEVADDWRCKLSGVEDIFANLARMIR